MLVNTPDCSTKDYQPIQLILSWYGVTRHRTSHIGTKQRIWPSKSLTFHFVTLCFVHLIAVTQLRVYYILTVSSKVGADAFGDDSNINQNSCTGRQVSHVVIKPIISSDTFIRPRQKHKQHSSTIYKKYKKYKKKLDKRNMSKKCLNKHLSICHLDWSSATSNSLRNC